MKRYFAYIRVSTQRQGQSGSSLQEQRDAIVAFAQRNNFYVAEWFEDRETAAKKGRTQFVRMVSSIEKGQAAGAILHKIDRGARNLWDWARLQDLIDAGREVHFVHDNLDLTSRGGRLAADIQAVVAADYVRNLRDEVLKGVRGRLKQGLYPWPAPVGYLNCGGGKPKEIDPLKGPLVQLAFELYAAEGHSFDRLARELQKRGLCQPDGRALSLKGITTILRNPFYIGIIRVKKTGEVFQGVHEPIVSVQLFRCVQAVIDGRVNRKVRKHDFAFRRLFTCGLCGHFLIGELQKGHVYYRCQTPMCPTTAVREDKVRSAMRHIVRALPFDACKCEQLLPYIETEARRTSMQHGKELAALRLRVKAIEKREQNLTDAYLDQLIDRDSYSARKMTLLTSLAEAREDLTRASAKAATDLGQLARRFLELLKTLELGPESGSLHEYRSSIEIMTSNRKLVGKKLEISTHFPFRTLETAPVLSFGGPHRRGTRTFDGLRDRKRERARQTTNWEAQANLLLEYLKKPEVAEQLGPIALPPHTPNPAWFKRRPPPGHDAAEAAA